MSGPADQLEGLTLEGGWVVGFRVSPRPGGTGGCFSTGYLISHPDGRKGFLKAMDYTRAFAAVGVDFVDAVKLLTDAYVFERDICVRCQDARITRVVHAIEHGSHVGPLPHERVQYLIFERADGDVRAFLDQQATFDIAFALRTLHGAAAALRQMHLARMAHQDLKPSNVLLFLAERKTKLGDLGRAWAEGIPAPHDGLPIAGDQGYAPPELLYGVPLAENAKRFGYDMYLLGSLVVFLFTRAHINGLLVKHLDPAFGALTLTYAEALPYLHAAFADAVDEFSSTLPKWLRGELCELVRQLCEPDYTKRGNPGRLGMRRYALDRYVSIFDRLRRKAEHELWFERQNVTHT